MRLMMAICFHHVILFSRIVLPDVLVYWFMHRKTANQKENCKEQDSICLKITNLDMYMTPSCFKNIFINDSYMKLIPENHA